MVSQGLGSKGWKVCPGPLLVAVQLRLLVQHECGRGDLALTDRVQGQGRLAVQQGLLGAVPLCWMLQKE